MDGSAELLRGLAEELEDEGLNVSLRTHGVYEYLVVFSPNGQYLGNIIIKDDKISCSENFLEPGVLVVSIADPGSIEKVVEHFEI